MGRIFITFGLFFFAISVLGIYLDVLLHIDGSVGYTQIGQMWYKYAPNSLQIAEAIVSRYIDCLLYTSPSPRDMRRSRMPSSA